MKKNLLLRTLNKIASKSTDVIFESIIEEDFNPDLVNLGLLDSYISGLYKGLAVGAGTVSIAAVIAIAIVVMKNKEKKDEQIL